MQPDRFDLILRGGRIVDGSGAASYIADLGIVGDRIAAIGDLSKADATRIHDVSGKIVAPGFIDTHTHDDTAVMLWPDMPMKVSQGVTTVVIGNCGISLAPADFPAAPPPPLDLIGDRETYRFRSMADYLDTLDRSDFAVNVVALVGHTSLRATVMDDLKRTATPDEIERMRELLIEGLEAGAVGFSTGLFYPPARHATTDEVVSLAKTVAEYGGLYCTHMRDEADSVIPSLHEAFEIGERAGVPVLVSHHKVMGKRNHGLTVETLKIIEQARDRMPIAIDAYPYTASSTILTMERVRQSSSVLITWSVKVPDAVGKTLSDLAAEFGCSEEEAVERLSPAGAIYFVMDEADVRRVLAWPETMIGSDGIPQDEFPHPRLWGTFPRVLGYYTREIGLFTVEQAVRKMTALAADAFGLKERGQLQQGFFADITVFDPDTVLDQATFTKPIQSSTGIELVLVNGSVVWEGGQTTGKRSGRAMRRKDFEPPMKIRRERLSRAEAALN